MRQGQVDSERPWEYNQAMKIETFNSKKLVRVRTTLAGKTKERDAMQAEIDRLAKERNRIEAERLRLSKAYSRAVARSHAEYEDDKAKGILAWRGRMARGQAIS